MPDLTPQVHGGAGLKGNSLYTLAPGFAGNVSKWVPFAKIPKFTAFMSKWDDPPPLTAKDKIEIIIQLGVLKYEPQWLTPDSLKLVGQFYPGLRKKQEGHTGYLDNGLTMIASNEYNLTELDAMPCCEIKLAQAEQIIEKYGPEVFPMFDELEGQAGNLADKMSGFLASISLNRPAIAQALNSTLTQSAIDNISKGVAAICSQPDACSARDSPPEVPMLGTGRSDYGNNGDCGPEQKNRYQDIVENRCGSATACNATDSRATLSEKIGQASRCIDARKIINNVCYNGGDAGHNNAISERIAQINRCNRLWLMQNSPEEIMTDLLFDIERNFSGEKFPGEDNFVDYLANDINERRNVISWVARFIDRPISEFLFDGSAASTVAMIYASPLGVKWLIPRFMFDYVNNYKEDKYSIYPIMGQLDKSEFTPKKRERIREIMSPNQRRVICKFIEFLDKKGDFKDDFNYTELISFWG